MQLSVLMLKCKASDAALLSYEVSKQRWGPIFDESATKAKT